MADPESTARPPIGRPLIESYGGGGFKVMGVRHAGSLLIFPDAVEPWPVTSAADISAGALEHVVRRARDATGRPSGSPQVRILIVGCGAAFIPRPPALDAELRALGVGLEWMATGAACRTFNVLLLEDREVAAALIAVD